MAEAKKEAEHFTSDSDQSDFILPDLVTDKQNSIPPDGYVNIDYEDLVNPDYDCHPSGYIHEIVRQGSLSEDEQEPVAVNSASDLSTGEESSEEQQEVRY